MTLRSTRDCSYRNRNDVPPRLRAIVKTIDSTLSHRIIPPEAGNADRHPALILLHGRGADEEDLLGLAEFLDRRLMLIGVRAPYPFAYGGGYTWYDAGTMGEPDPHMFTSSYGALSTFVDDALRAYPVDPQRLFLFGFSMGTAMAYAIALTKPELFRGVVANSGYIPEKTPLVFKWNGLKGTEFFVSHGVSDPVIPITLGRRAKELFMKANAPLTYREYPMGHQISEESLADATAWLTDQLNSRERV